MNDRILVAYATESGSTAGVAEAVGKQLAAAGASVDVRRVQEVKDVGGYRAVVVGSPVRCGKWLPEAVKFLEANRSKLNQMPTACFAVCMLLATGQEEHRRLAATFLDSARAVVRPVAEAMFAGALWPKKYRNPVTRFGVKMFGQSIKMDEGDYRDWEAIGAWADSLRPVLLQ